VAFKEGDKLQIDELEIEVTEIAGQRVEEVRIYEENLLLIITKYEL